MLIYTVPSKDNIPHTDA